MPYQLHVSESEARGSIRLLYAVIHCLVIRSVTSFIELLVTLSIKSKNSDGSACCSIAQDVTRTVVRISSQKPGALSWEVVEREESYQLVHHNVPSCV